MLCFATSTWLSILLSNTLSCSIISKFIYLSFNFYCSPQLITHYQKRVGEKFLPNREGLRCRELLRKKWNTNSGCPKIQNECCPKNWMSQITTITVKDDVHRILCSWSFRMYFKVSYLHCLTRLPLQTTIMCPHCPHEHVHVFVNYFPSAYPALCRVPSL